jgi:xanthine dehydrogenase small subunit
MRAEIRFLLGNELREIAAGDPTQTALDWLRLGQRLTGTKEGCAEGDCGACTIVVGELRHGRVRYEAVNACIRLLATLDGRHVLTVEHLKRADGTLHPVQQAMVDCHGSQCGFCTPGFVMSLYALWLNEDRPTVARIDDALAGNLCRCTGYQPIIEAAQRMYELGAPDDDARMADREGIAAKIAALQDSETISFGGGVRRFLAPATVDALAPLVIENPGATLLAGATDVGLWITKEMRVLDTVVYLGRIEALRTIEDHGTHLRIGAIVSHTQARAALAALHPQLGELLRRFAGEQIRNAGTVGGNIANGSPIGDLPPALIAMGATLVLRRGQARREIALEDYFLAYKKQDRAPGEFVEAVLVPKLGDGALFHVSKISKRFDEDISTLCGAFHLTLDADGRIASARVAFGGMAATPKRALLTEAALTGHMWSEETVTAAGRALARDYQPITDLRASSKYRLMAAANLLLRFFVETTQPDTQARVAGSIGSLADA